MHSKYLLGTKEKNMGFITVLCGILVWASAAFAVVITGSVFDNSDKTPIKDVSITFRLPSLPIQNHVLYSDSTGSFSGVFITDQTYPLQYYLEKTGYVAKLSEIPVNQDSITLGDIYLDRLTQASVWFCGTLIDSVTGSPLSGVELHFTRYQGSYSSIGLDTTDSLGKFGYSAEVTNNSSVYWTINITGYYQLDNKITTAVDSLNQTLRLKPWGSWKIPVQGRVIDSLTGAPVPNAKVVLVTNYWNTKPCSTYTDNLGQFNYFAERGTGTGEEMPRLRYIITAQGFIQKTWFADIGNKTSVDLGDIKLAGVSAGVLKRPFAMQPVKNGVDRAVFLINGRMVANGMVKKRMGGQQVMIRVEGEKGEGKRELRVK
jgi:hypothetical protein